MEVICVLYGACNVYRHRTVVVITTIQLHSTKPELRFCAGINPANVVWEIRDGERLWKWSRLEIRLNAFRQSTIPQKFIIIIIVSIIIIISSSSYWPIAARWVVWQWRLSGPILDFYFFFMRNVFMLFVLFMLIKNVLFACFTFCTNKKQLKKKKLLFMLFVFINNIFCS